ncbi:MAG: hypothetical protein COZ47_05055 [Lysobacterales bacterium CG_4_10_14_3_um_filter_64_11]|nr:MAG: hypothetical protein COZ47_05055 [Xanthomonadales bacterium CG_4_10_14_3_um_filter_64_11]
MSQATTSPAGPRSRSRRARPPLYSAEQRARRDASAWTLVQGVLAPLQFLVFLVSLTLVLRFLVTGQGEQAAAASVLCSNSVPAFTPNTAAATTCAWPPHCMA